MRVFACSDLHVDHAPNRACVEALSREDFRDDVLLLAGDVTDDLGLLGDTLSALRERFARVFFVPGNHELWERRGRVRNALARFETVLGLAQRLRIDTAPALVGEGAQRVRIVPLFSWYRRPHEGTSSLFVPKPGERSGAGWVDDRLVHWPERLGTPPADYFLALNEPRLGAGPEPVISFSHFLPRRELMFSDGEPRARDPHPEFNFSRVAGCSLLDAQIRRVGAVVHVYGHQHRNRDRHIDGVRYVSHCLGYPRERAGGHVERAATRPRRVFPAD